MQEDENKKTKNGI